LANTLLQTATCTIQANWLCQDLAFLPPWFQGML
jgi:hypothetical protein